MVGTAAVAAGVGVLLPFPFYCALWNHPQRWVDLCGRGANPCRRMAQVSHVLKALQLLSLASVASFSWPPPLYSVVVLAFGQYLNFRVYQLLGESGTYYGVRFGKKIPWVTEFPFGYIKDPQASSTAHQTTMAVAACARTSSLLRALVVSRWPPLRSIHEGPDTIHELLDRHLAKKSPTSSAALLDDDAAEAEARRRLTSSRREALGLYRDILRATRLFAWPDERGVPWREVLRANARREFEEARDERDPEVVARLLISGRDAVQQTLDRLAEASRRMVEAEEAKRRGGA